METKLFQVAAQEDQEANQEAGILGSRNLYPGIRRLVFLNQKAGILESWNQEAGILCMRMISSSVKTSEASEEHGLYLSEVLVSSSDLSLSSSLMNSTPLTLKTDAPVEKKLRNWCFLWKEITIGVFVLNRYIQIHLLNFFVLIYCLNIFTGLYYYCKTKFN